MSIREIIAIAGANRHTIMITAREKDGSVETREAEPYSYKQTKENELFIFYDIAKQGTRSFIVSNIISVDETNNSFSPKWPIEV
ncbi:MAG: hypothetical protein KJ952_04160 [Candidatus Omnitrophica bacterium]|nr:hypothetical protein [Candidatus Omnitrophota bacterium]